MSRTGLDRTFIQSLLNNKYSNYIAHDGSNYKSLLWPVQFILS